MTIINTFISDNPTVPAYTAISLKKARELNPSTDIYFICKKAQPYFKSLNINWVSQDEINSPLIEQFNELSWLTRHGTPKTDYPSPDNFWHKTCERIFYLSAFSKELNPEWFVHTENDVLMFYSLEELIRSANDTFSAIVMSPKQATFALTYVPDASYMENLCLLFLELMKLGEETLISSLNEPHISEMSLLRYAMENAFIDTLPIVPIEGYDYVFDPGSYGQFLGGTNNGHGIGYKDEYHLCWQIGAEAYMKDGLPYVSFDGMEKPLFNLHVHSKKLELFV
jgi:hypothetical protein